MIENYWLIAFVCFVIFTIGNIFLYSLDFLDRPTWIGMIIVSIVPVINLIVALVMIATVIRVVVFDIAKAFEN